MGERKKERGKRRLNISLKKKRRGEDIFSFGDFPYIKGEKKWLGIIMRRSEKRKWIEERNLRRKRCSLL